MNAVENVKEDEVRQCAAGQCTVPSEILHTLGSVLENQSAMSVNVQSMMENQVEIIRELKTSNALLREIAEKSAAQNYVQETLEFSE